VRQSLQPYVSKLIDQRDLSQGDAQAVIGALMRGEATHEQSAALLAAWRDKGVTADELTGAALAMRASSTKITVPPGILVDTCGTGGDGLGTFNISTVAALLVAGAGARVAKHGNRGVTSGCGSADVLMALGVKVDVEPDVVSRCLDAVGFGFLYAPRFHPAMRHVAPVRQQLGFRTIFNLLGPLTNPAGATHQVVGVADARLADVMGRVLQRLGTRHALVVHGDDGLDEVSTTGPTHVVEIAHGRMASYTITPEQFGFSRTSLDRLRGGDPATCARIAREVLEGMPGPSRDAALLNAGCALYVAEAAADIDGGVAMARRALDSGRALTTLETLKTVSNTP